MANLRLLIKSGAYPDARNSVGQNCLHICIQFADAREEPNGLRRALVELIRQGADVNATDHSGNTVTDVAFHRLDPQGAQGTYPADLWACSLAACGYDVLGEFQGGQARLTRCDSQYEKKHFESLWEGIEDRSYILNNVLSLPRETLNHTFPEVLKTIPQTELRTLLDFHLSFFEGTNHYEWIPDLRQAGVDMESIQAIIVSDGEDATQELFFDASPGDLQTKKTTGRFPQPQFHHSSCCHYETLQTISTEPETWLGDGDVAGKLSIATRMEPLARHFFTCQPLKDQAWFFRFPFPSRDLDTWPLKVETAQLRPSRGSEGLGLFKTVWQDILHLAAEWQTAGLCCDRISIMLQNKPSQVDLEPILLQHLLGVNQELALFASIFADDMKSQDKLSAMASEMNGQFPYTSTLYRKLFRGLQGIELLDREFVVPSSRKQTLHHFCLLTQAVGLAMLLYQQCHTGHIHPYFLQRPISSIDLEGYESYHNADRRDDNADFRHATESYNRDFKLTVRLQDLTCAGKMLGSPVFVFTTIPSQTEPAMLYSSCEDLVDTFGQCNIISTDADNRLNTVVGVRIGGGTIFPTKGRLPSDQRLFHWGDFPTDIDEPSTFGYTQKILIGAPVTNNGCTLKEEDARREAKAAGLLSLVHVLKPFWFKDQVQAGLQGGQYVNLTAGVVWKRSPGRSLKEAVLDGYALNKSLHFLNDLSGLQFSICTGLARRIPLRELLVESPLFDILDHAGIQAWDSIKENVRELFKAPISHEILRDQCRFPRETLHEACRILLGHLQPTGVGMDGQLRILWPTSDEPGYCFVADPERHPHFQWCHMIRDSEWCATFAAMTTMCIETEGHRCPGRESTAPWRLESSLLSTGMFQPDTAGTVLRVGASYWVGDTGSGVWVTVREPEQGTQVLILNKPLPPSIPKFARRILGWEALRESYMRETFSTDVIVYSRRRSH